MARFAVSCNIKTSAINNISTKNAGPITDPVNGATTAADQAVVVANVATLVADGASPTQAHVTALNTNFTTLVADISAVPANSDVVISFNATTVVTRSVLRHAIQRLLATIEGSNMLTP